MNLQQIKLCLISQNLFLSLYIQVTSCRCKCSFCFEILQFCDFFFRKLLLLLVCCPPAISLHMLSYLAWMQPLEIQFIISTEKETESGLLTSKRKVMSLVRSGDKSPAMALTALTASYWENATWLQCDWCSLVFCRNCWKLFSQNILGFPKGPG